MTFDSLKGFRFLILETSMLTKIMTRACLTNSKKTQISFLFLNHKLSTFWSFPGGSHSKASPYNVGDPDSLQCSILWVEKICWRRKWQSTPVLLPGKSHGWRSLVGYSPCGRKESDTTEQLHFHCFFFPLWVFIAHLHSDVQPIIMNTGLEYTLRLL